MATHPYTRLFVLPSAPTADEDETEGYEIGDTVHVLGGSIYECRDASTGAAVWEEHGSGGGTEVDPVFTASEAASFVTGDKAKLDGIEPGAQVNDPETDASAISVTDAGDYFTGSDVEAVLQELGAGGGGGFNEGARVYHNTTQTVNNATHTALTFNSERYDTDTIHDTGTNPTRLTCKTAGIYSIKAAVAFPDNATGVRMAYIRLNGTDIIAIQEFMAVTTASVATACTPCTDWNMALNDYVEIVLWQNSGSNLTIAASDKFQAEFMMQRIG